MDSIFESITIEYILPSAEEIIGKIVEEKKSWREILNEILEDFSIEQRDEEREYQFLNLPKVKQKKQNEKMKTRKEIVEEEREKKQEEQIIQIEQEEIKRSEKEEKEKEEMKKIIVEQKEEEDKRKGMDEKEKKRLKNVIVLLSGGLGSISSLCKVIKKKLNPSVVYFENSNSEMNLNNARREAVAEVMVESRNFDGLPLADFKDGKWISWLNSIEFEKNINQYFKKSSREEKVIIMVAKLWDIIREYQNDYSNIEKYYLVWGDVRELKEVFKMISLIWPFIHCCPVQSREEALMEVLLNERRGKLFESYPWNITREEQAPGYCLPKEITNKICSCWGNHYQEKKDIRESLSSLILILSPEIHQKKNNENSGDKTEKSRKMKKKIRPFLNLCGDCEGCLRDYNAWKNIKKWFPFIRPGSMKVLLKDDDRHFQNFNPEFLSYKKIMKESLKEKLGLNSEYSSCEKSSQTLTRKINFQKNQFSFSDDDNDISESESNSTENMINDNDEEEEEIGSEEEENYIFEEEEKEDEEEDEENKELIEEEDDDDDDDDYNISDGDNDNDSDLESLSISEILSINETEKEEEEEEEDDDDDDDDENTEDEDIENIIENLSGDEDELFDNNSNKSINKRYNYIDIF